MTTTGVPSNKRGELIARFKTDPNKKIFLSTDAGGQGLNLQEASVVINVDLPWNPAVLEQRIGRVYRLGQEKSVRVNKLITLDSIEYQMQNRLLFKSRMAAGILDAGESDIFFGDEETKGVIDTIADTLDLENMSESSFEKENEAIEKEVSADRNADQPINLEEMVIEDDSFAETRPSKESTSPNEVSITQQEQMAQVMNQGLQFLSGMIEMMTGGTASFKDQKFEFDQETGEVLLRFKISEVTKG